MQAGEGGFVVTDSTLQAGKKSIQTYLVSLLSTHFEKGKLLVESDAPFRLFLDQREIAKADNATTRTCSIELQPSVAHTLTLRLLSNEGGKAKWRIRFVPQRKDTKVSFRTDDRKCRKEWNHYHSLLNRLFELRLTQEELHSIATELGADCPFFLNHSPQLAEGIGERLTPFPVDLKGKHLALLLSDVSISTRVAYSGVQPTEEGPDITEVLRQPIEEWRGLLQNHFEQHIFALYPSLREGKELLYQAGATYAAMSGSGSTLFGISDHPLNIEGWSGKQLNYTL